MKPVPRPTESYIHGIQAPVVIVPARVAAWLERHAALNEVRISNRGRDPEVDNVLAALRLAALRWRTSVTGTNQAAKPELGPESKYYSTTQAANILNITDRAVRKAIQTHRLHATNIAGRWRINTEDLAHYQQAHAA